jgi:hypothetical protein
MNNDQYSNGDDSGVAAYPELDVGLIRAVATARNVCTLAPNALSREPGLNRSSLVSSNRDPRVGVEKTRFRPRTDGARLPSQPIAARLPAGSPPYTRFLYFADHAASRVAPTPHKRASV